MTKEEWYRQLFERLGNSKFRSGFHLKQKDIDYINEKGRDTILIKRVHMNCPLCDKTHEVEESV